MYTPRIAIAPSYNGDRLTVSDHYYNAVYEAGGIPACLPRTTDKERIRLYAESFDGFILSGGVDVDPARYGEEVTGAEVEIEQERDIFEFALLDEIVKLRKPILGICRGIQVLNVYFGGSLIQHIDGHRQHQMGLKWFEFKQHVNLKENTLLANIIGKTETMTNTYHHQVVKILAPGMVCNAVSDDGYIEAINMTDYPFLLGVQWHPEIIRDKNPDALAIFKALIEESGKQNSIVK